jgi:hypothetical protein
MMSLQSFWLIKHRSGISGAIAGCGNRSLPLEAVSTQAITLKR